MAGERPAPQDQRHFRSRIVVGNIPEVLNPEEEALRLKIEKLGLPIREVRIGKLFHVTHDAPDSETALSNAKNMARSPLSNPIYEEVRIVETVEVSTPISPVKPPETPIENV